MSSNAIKPGVFANSIPALLSLAVTPFTGKIVDGVNVNLISINSNTAAFLPDMWLIVSTVLIIIYGVLIVNTALKLRDWFSPSPAKAEEWVSYILSFLYMLIPSFIYAWLMIRLAIYFLKNLPSA